MFIKSLFICTVGWVLSFCRQVLLIRAVSRPTVQWLSKTYELLFFKDVHVLILTLCFQLHHVSPEDTGKANIYSSEKSGISVCWTETYRNVKKVQCWGFKDVGRTTRENPVQYFLHLIPVFIVLMASGVKTALEKSGLTWLV